MAGRALPWFSEAGRPLRTQEKHLSAEAMRTEAFLGRGRWLAKKEALLSS